MLWSDSRSYEYYLFKAFFIQHPYLNIFIQHAYLDKRYPDWCNACGRSFIYIKKRTP